MCPTVTLKTVPTVLSQKMSIITEDLIIRLLKGNIVRHYSTYELGHTETLEARSFFFFLSQSDNVK